MNAAGTLGFAPQLHGTIDLERLGAFVTDPVSLRSRSPAKDRRFIPYPGGFMLHTGYPNPGLREVVRRNRNKWERSPLPVIVHLLAETPKSLAEMVIQLEGIEGVVGVEVSLPLNVEAHEVSDFTQAAMGELPVLVRLPLDRAVEFAGLFADSGIAALSLGPLRGFLPDGSGGFVHGRLFGPGLFPQALNVLSELVQYDLPVVGAGGVYSKENIEAMLASGAFAVQLDSVLWRGGW